MVASAVVGARYGQTDEEAFIVITSPPPYSQVDASGMITVTGRGGRLPADKLTVRVVDGSGRILLEQPTSITPTGDTGEGDWIAVLPLTYSGRGKIAAFSTDEASGSVVAVAVVDVVFGDPSQQDHFVAITYPLPGSVLTSKTRLFAVAGYAGGVLPDTVQVLVADELGDILAAWRPTQVDPVTGFWWVAGPVDVTVGQERTLSVQAIGAADNSGSVAGRDRVDLKVRKTEEVLDGAVYLPEGVTLPEGAIVTVSVRNVSLADAPPEVTLLGEQVITGTLTSPIPFAIVYSPAVVDQNALYSATARVEDGAGTLLYISTQQTPVITQDNPVTDVQIAAVAPSQ